MSTNLEHGKREGGKAENERHFYKWINAKINYNLPIKKDLDISQKSIKINLSHKLKFSRGNFFILNFFKKYLSKIGLIYEPKFKNIDQSPFRIQGKLKGGE